MRIERRLGDRLQITTLPVCGLKANIYNMLESDLAIAWSKVRKPQDARLFNPRFVADQLGWAILSSVSGERIASAKLVPPKRGRPRT